MAHADFVHLRVHSAFSLSEGAILIPDLIDLCKRHAMPAVAVTDSGNLFGAMQFSEACFKGGIQPIIGCLLPLEGAAGPEGLPVLVQDETGYGNLVKLVSHAFLESEPGDPPHITTGAIGVDLHGPKKPARHFGWGWVCRGRDDRRRPDIVQMAPVRGFFH